MHAIRRPAANAPLNITIPIQGDAGQESLDEPTSECQSHPTPECHDEPIIPMSIEQATETNPWGLPSAVWDEVPNAMRAYKYVDDILQPLIAESPSLYKTDRYILLLETPETRELKVLKIILKSNEIVVFSALRISPLRNPYLLYADMLCRGKSHDFILMPYYKTTLYDVMIDASTLDLRRALSHIDQLAIAIELTSSPD
jgi:hypothetical protein